jgi:hypothetical protein
MLKPDSKPFLWLGVVASITGILGFLAELGPDTFVPLKATIPIPLWLAIGLVALIWLGTAMMVHRATKSLADQVSSDQIKLFEARTEINQLTNRLLASNSRTIASKPDKSCVERLASYEALEKEIVGLLASGARMSLAQIIDSTSVSLQPDRQARVTRAIAALGSLIDGSDGSYCLSRGTRTGP